LVGAPERQVNSIYCRSMAVIDVVGDGYDGIKRAVWDSSEKIHSCGGDL
jgi:hypothetical protein